MKKRHSLFLFIIILLVSCSSSSQTSVSDEVAFVGKGDNWDAKYIYNAKLYNEKHINWVELKYKDENKTDFSIDYIDIEIKSRDSTITGNVGDMETKIDKHTIIFMVGTVNKETYKEDEFVLTIKYKGERDVIKLKVTD